VSAGQGRGFLVDVPGLAEAARDGRPAVLYASALSPDLAVYLSQVVAIVAETGGALSHLAILARERGIPVVACWSLASSGLALGDDIKVDGTAGTVARGSA
jgi:pyruvate,water dikinase